MIVVDTNIIAYLYLPTEQTPLAEQLLAQDAHWIAPILWRSEFRNVLALYLRKALLNFEQAFSIQTEAESLLSDREFEVSSYDGMRLVQTSECSSYDCEFVSLAQRFDLKLITADKKILTEFPATAMSLEQALLGL